MAIEKQVAEVEVRVTGEKKSESTIKKFTNFLKSRFVVTLGDIVRIGKKVISFFTKASKKAQEQEAVVKSLNQALINQGIYTDELTESLQKQAAALQKVTTYGDEEIISLQSQLISFGIAVDRIDDVTRATLDLATAQGFSLFTAGQLISKSLGSSTNALTRYGIEISGAVGSTERLDMAVKNISEKFGGQATAQTETFRGATQQLNNSWGDLQETIAQFANDELIPLIKNMDKAVKKIDEFFGAMGGGDDIERLEKRLASLRNGLKMLASQPDPFGAYDDAISKRINLIESLEWELQLLRNKSGETTEEIIDDGKQLVIAQAKAGEAQGKAFAKQQQEKEDAIEKSNLAQMKSVNDLGNFIVDSVKRRAIAELTIEEEKTIGEIALALASAIARLDFAGIGSALSQLAVPAATAGAKIGAINAVGFEQGGQFESRKTTSGQTALSNEGRTVERVTVEPIGRPETQGNMTANITVMLGNKELKTIATELKPYLDAKNRRVF